MPFIDDLYYNIIRMIEDEIKGKFNNIKEKLESSVNEGNDISNDQMMKARNDYDFITVLS